MNRASYRHRRARALASAVHHIFWYTRTTLAFTENVLTKILAGPLRVFRKTGTKTTHLYTTVYYFTIRLNGTFFVALQWKNIYLKT